ncbi:TPA: hypothetical protein ACPXMY_002772 [Vibrio metoecus]
MRYRYLLLVFLLFQNSNVTASQIYKCKKGSSDVFQDFPCSNDFDYGISDIDTFDSWKFGMNILAMKKEAEKRKIPLNPGQISIFSKYNDKHVNSNENARIYTYNDVFSGKNIKVTLFFTQNTQKLYKINVIFMVMQLPIEEKRYFYDSLVNQLSVKYGSYIEARNYPSTSNFISKMILRDLVGTEKLWGLNTGFVISLIGDTAIQSVYELNYKHIPLLEQSLVEAAQDIQDRTDKGFVESAVKL